MPDVQRGPQPGTEWSSSPSVANSAGEAGSTHTQFFAADGRAPQQDIPSPFPPQAASPLSSHDAPFPNPAQPGFPYPGESAHQESNANGPTHGFPPEWHPGYFNAYGAPSQGAYPAGYGPESRAPDEDKPVSSLHLALIGMILLIGFAIGVGRWWWIDQKLETASTKNPVIAKAPAPPAIDEPPASSIQSSIDRAYIPPALEPDSDTQTEDRGTDLTMDAGPVKTPSAPAASGAKLKSDPLPGSEQVDRPKTTDDSDKAKPASPPAEQSNGQQENKRAYAKENSSRKSTSVTKKERMKEIDRVRSQAYSETSKDRIGGRKSGSSGSSIGPQSERRNSYRAAKLAQHTVTSAQYARCERISHIIRREQCKWQLCNNKWGKGACPSFKHEKPSLF